MTTINVYHVGENKDEKFNSYVQVGNIEFALAIRRKVRKRYPNAEIIIKKEKKMLDK